MMTLTGKKALLVGGSCDLALSLAPMLLERGIHVTLTVRSQEAGQKVAEALAGKENWASVLFDMERATTPEGFQALNDLFEEHGPDYLVDFSHGHLEGLVAGLDAAEMAAYFAANISGRGALVSWATKQMLQKRFGRLLYVSSTAAVLPNRGQGLYAAAKQAGEALYKSVGIEMAKRGITSAILRPGYVAAGRAEAFLAENEAWMKKRVPLGRPATPDEVAGTLMFLLTDEAQAINATAITMDGGMTACK